MLRKEGYKYMKNWVFMVRSQPYARLDGDWRLTQARQGLNDIMA